MNSARPKPSRFRRAARLGILLFGFALVAVVAVSRGRPRAVFEGKTATQWLLSFDNNVNHRKELDDARVAFEKLGTQALPELVSVLRERPNSFKQRLLDWAQRLHIVGQQPYLPEVQWRAAQVCQWIGRSGGDISTAVPALERHLWENYRNDAVEYARGLAEAGEAGKRSLLRCLDGPSVPTCEAAAMELHRFKDDVAVVQALVSATTNTNAQVRMGAFMALRGKSAVQPKPLIASALVRGLGDSDGSARWFAAEAAINYLDQPGVVTALEKARTDPKPEVQRAAERALKLNGR